MDTAIQAMKEGAQEYIVKPCHPQEISMLVSRILKLKKLQSEKILRKKISRQYRHRDMITKNPRMEEILALTREIASIRSAECHLRRAADTGKELVARAIHYSGERAGKSGL